MSTCGGSYSRLPPPLRVAGGQPGLGFHAGRHADANASIRSFSRAVHGRSCMHFGAYRIVCTLYCSREEQTGHNRVQRERPGNPVDRYSADLELPCILPGCHAFRMDSSETPHSSIHWCTMSIPASRPIMSLRCFTSSAWFLCRACATSRTAASPVWAGPAAGRPCLRSWASQALCPAGAGSLPRLGGPPGRRWYASVRARPRMWPTVPCDASSNANAAALQRALAQLSRCFHAPGSSSRQRRPWRPICAGPHTTAS